MGLYTTFSQGKLLGTISQWVKAQNKLRSAKKKSKKMVKPLTWIELRSYNFKFLDKRLYETDKIYLYVCHDQSD